MIENQLFIKEISKALTNEMHQIIEYLRNILHRSTYAGFRGQSYYSIEVTFRLEMLPIQEKKRTDLPTCMTKPL